jgi:hypothetical protein
MNNYMGRRFILDVDAAGNVTIREQGAKRGAGLPVYSTDTREQAETLQVMHCKLDRYGSGIYTLNKPPASVEALGAIAEMFSAARNRLLASGHWVAAVGS